MGEQQARSKRKSSFKNLSSSSTTSSGTRALARGSSSMVGTRNTPQPSQLSTFQLSEEERTSQLEMTRPRPKVDNSKMYMIVVIGILLCAVAVLVFLLAL